MKDFSVRYAVFKVVLSFAHRLFYKKIVVENIENVPLDEPIIFAPNHQNAVMDPLAVLFTTKLQVVFLARADVFENPFVAWILTGFKILPVYRIRDGVENLQKNDEIFEKSITILENRKSICLFPEAAHTDKRRLQPLKKGIPRIALQAEEKNNFNLGLKIIPVGIYYEDYPKSRRVLHVKYGESISVSDYKEIYQKNGPKALNDLRIKLSESITPLMININDKENYQVYESLRDLYNNKMRDRLNLNKSSQINKFKTDKKIISLVEDYSLKDSKGFVSLTNNVTDYYNMLLDNNISCKVVKESKYSWLKLIAQLIISIALLPLFLLGLVNNLIPYIIPKLFVTKVKDIQFHSSLKYVLGIILFPLFYVMQTVFVLQFTDNVILEFLYLPTILLLGLFAGYYWDENLKIFSKLKFNSLLNRKKNKMAKLISLQEEIISTMDEIIEKD